MAQPDEKTLTLRKPVTLGGTTYDHLELREPTAGEREKASAGAGAVNNTSFGINLIAAIAKVPRKVAESLSQRDYQEATEYLAGFSLPGPEIGESSSPS